MTEQQESGRMGLKTETLGDRVVNRVTDGVLDWWERVGPKRVEDRWVAAHQRVLNAIPDGDQRKNAFRKTAERWRKIGGAAGATATAVDFSLAGVALWLSTREPRAIFDWLTSSGWSTTHHLDRVAYGLRMSPRLYYRFNSWIDNTFSTPWPGLTASELDKEAYRKDFSRKDRRRILVGRLFSFIPGLGAVGIATGAGPAHAVAELSARAAESLAARGIKQRQQKSK